MTKIFPYLCSSAAIALAFPACAQNAAASGASPASTPAEAQKATTQPNNVEDIVVTARRVAESLQSIPVAVTALSSSKLAENRVTTVSDLTTQAPSLHINTQNRRDNPIIAIRGLRQSDVLLGQDAAVGFYVNEVAFSYTPGINQGLFDVQSVQILKGAQGTLFGRNATGGAILVSTQKPSDTVGGYALLGGTAFDHGLGGEAEAALNLPLGDKVQLRVAGRLVHRDGYVANVAPRNGTYYASPDVGGTTDFDKGGDERSEAVRASLRIMPLDGVTNDTVAQYSRIREHGAAFNVSAVNPFGYAAFVYGPLMTQAANRVQGRSDFWSYETNQNGGGDTRSLMLSNTTAVESGNITFKNIFGYRHVKVADYQDFDGTALPILEAANTANVKELSDELQMQGHTEGGINYVAGLFYYRQTGNSGDLASVFGGSSSSQGGHVSNSSKAVFAQATIPLSFISDRLTLTAGGRYSWDDRAATLHPYLLATGQCIYTNADGSVPSNANCFIPGKVNYSTPTWTDGLDYKIDSDTLVYFTNRRGFRSGGFNLRATNPGEFAPFRPEKVTDYEIGLKRTWHPGLGRLRTNIALFHTEYADVQRFIVSKSAQSITTVINAASAHVNGGEAEFDWKFSPSFNLSGFYSYVNAKYDNFVTGTGDFTKNKFAQVPKSSGSVTARWTLPVASRAGEFVLQGNVYAQSRIFFSDVEQSAAYGPSASVSQAGYALGNVRVEWNHMFGTNASVALYVSNVTNKKYYAHGVNLYQSIGLNVVTAGDPRTFGLTSRYEF